MLGVNPHDGTTQLYSFSMTALDPEVGPDSDAFGQPCIAPAVMLRAAPPTGRLSQPSDEPGVRRNSTEGSQSGMRV